MRKVIFKSDDLLMIANQKYLRSVGVEQTNMQHGNGVSKSFSNKTFAYKIILHIKLYQ